MTGPLHKSLTHDSAILHVTGAAEYADDIPEPAGTLHAWLGLSTVAHGEIGVRASMSHGSLASFLMCLRSRPVNHLRRSCARM